MCEICGWQPVYAKGVCRSDYVFRRRHKRDRTEDEIVRMGEKYLQRADHAFMLSA